MADDSWVVDVANQAGSPEKFADLVVDKLREGTLEEGVKALNEYSYYFYRTVITAKFDSLLRASDAMRLIDVSMTAMLTLRDNFAQLFGMSDGSADNGSGVK